MGIKKPYFNGADETSVSKVYKFAGSKFTYRRQGHKEALSALGPIKERIVVKVSHVTRLMVVLYHGDWDGP